MEATDKSLVTIGDVQLRADEVEGLRDTIRRGRAASTLRAYDHDWDTFTRWCQGRGFPHLPAPPQVVALYCDQRARAGEAYAYICRGLAAIGRRHAEAGIDQNPRRSIEVNATMAGIRRMIGTKQRQVAPLLVEHMRMLVQACEGYTPESAVPLMFHRNLKQLAARRIARNKALILVGFLGAMRRSELVAMDVEDCGFCERGLVVFVARSKTDQDARGVEKVIPYCQQAHDICAVRALREWLDISGISNGAVFRGLVPTTAALGKRLHGHDVARVIKGLCTKAGLDSRQYAGHSLRAGLATEAFRGKVAERTIMRQTGHTSRATLDRYVRLARQWEQNVVTELGL